MSQHEKGLQASEPYDDGDLSTSSRDGESLDAEDAPLVGQGGDGSVHTRRRARGISWPTRLQIALAFFNCILFAASAFMFVKARSGGKEWNNLQEAYKATSYYSPVFNRFEIPSITTTTNGTFWDTDPPSVWRIRAGPEADAAWKSIDSDGVWPIIITADEVRRIGKDPRTVAKAPPFLGYGDEAYVAGVDVFHHIHCLNFIRRELSYKHYWEEKEGPWPGSEVHVSHVDHCMNVLRQVLECSGSVDMVTFNWVEGKKFPQPDFNNNKVCRDFGKLREWTMENMVTPHMFEIWGEHGPPEDVVMVPNPRPGW